MKKIICLVLSLVVAVSLLGGCGSQKETTADGTNTLSGSVSTNGSTSMENVIGALKEQFTNENAGVTISYDATGSGTGIEAVSNGSCDIGLSSRKLKDSETGLTATTIALDGIAVIANSGCGVENLTQQQVADIYLGKITNWKEVGGADLAIACIGRESSSGTRDGFESATSTKDACVLSQELTSTGAVIEAVKNSPNAIGYTSFSAVAGKTDIRVLTVDGVACSEATILDGSYAIQRPFNLVTKDGTTLSAAAQAFVTYASSAEAADLIRNAGAVPAA
ncbi:MAG: phosphate ABC transporter substrate-binding protein [Clostridiales bacterium]|nr:phosphate ABC transporter substrate-binding protein [Clostridiales bacterium]